MKPAYLGSCSETDYGGLEIISWLIEPQTAKCLKNEAKHFSSSAVRCDWIGVRGPSPSSQERTGTLDTAPRPPAGKISWEECSQLSASIQRLQIQFLWFLNQFLGYKWKREKATSMLPRIKAVAGLETPQNSTHWRKLFRRHLNPLHLCIASMENEITPILASECFSSYFTPGPKICQGPAGHVQSSGWRPVRGRRKGSRLKPVRNKAHKTVFAILLPDGKRKGQGNTEVTEWGSCFILDFSVSAVLYSLGLEYMLRQW